MQTRRLVSSLMAPNLFQIKLYNLYISSFLPRGIIGPLVFLIPFPLTVYKLIITKNISNNLYLTTYIFCFRYGCFYRQVRIYPVLCMGYWSLNGTTGYNGYSTFELLSVILGRYNEKYHDLVGSLIQFRSIFKYYFEPKQP